MLDVCKLVTYYIDEDNEEYKDDSCKDKILCIPEIIKDNKRKIYNYSINNYYNDKYHIDLGKGFDLREFKRSILGNRYTLYKPIGEIIDCVAVKDKKTKKAGFLSLNGDIAIKCEYDSVKPFINGVALVKKNGIDYFIDKENNIVHTPFGEEIGKYKVFCNSYNDGCICRWKFNERIRKVKVLSSFEYIKQFGVNMFNLSNNGVFLVTKYSALVVLKKNGRIVDTISFEEAKHLAKKLVNI